MIARTIAIRTYSRARGWLCSLGCSWVVSTTFVCIALPHRSVRQQVHHGEDHNPHHVNEVPVETDQLYRQTVPLSHFPAQRVQKQRQKHDHADRHVRSVESSQDEERGTEKVLAQGEAVIDEFGELVDLTAKKDRPEQRSRREPHAHLLHVRALDRRKSKYHR